MRNIQRGLGRGVRLLASRFCENGVILLYHRVAAVDRDPFKLCVSPDNFASQIAELVRVARPLPIGEFVRRQQAGCLPGRSVCITFDDGFLDFARDALPVLEKHAVPAAVYCVAGKLGESFWWDRLVAAIFEPPQLPPTLALGFDGSERILRTTGSRDRLMREIHGLLGAADEDQRADQLASLERQVGAGGIDSGAPRTMTAGELRELARHPLVSIGAHTMSHPRLASLRFERQAAEITGSIDRLSAVIGRPVETFSYPFGLKNRDYTKHTMAAVAAAGLDHALAVDGGVVTRRSNPYRLPRLWVHDICGSRFAKRIGHQL